MSASRPAVECRCDVDNCGNLVLAVYDGPIPTIVVSMGDLRYRIQVESARSYGLDAEAVRTGRLDDARWPAFREPIGYAGFNGTAWPLWGRCRTHGAALISRAPVESAYKKYQLSAEAQTMGVHPSPPEHR